MKIIFCILLLACSSSFAANDFLKLFSQKKPAIAAIMVQSHFQSQKELLKAQDWAVRQAEIASENGMDGILIEFRGGGILDTVISEKKMSDMTAILIAVKESFPKLVIGVEILWHFPGATLQIAKNADAKFVRVDFFSDAVIADGKKVPIDPKGLLAFRKKIGAEKIALLTDIQVKYSKMIDSKITIGQSAQRARASGSDGVIISGAKSGSAPDVNKLAKTKKAVPGLPVVIGSGFSLENAAQTLPHIDAIIVGTSISEKTGGPLLPEKVKNLMSFVQEARKTL